MKTKAWCMIPHSRNKGTVAEIEMRPLVLCCDCKHGEPTKNALGETVIKCHEICGLCGIPRLMNPNWFCADGERKDGGDDDADG